MPRNRSLPPHLETRRAGYYWRRRMPRSLRDWGEAFSDRTEKEDATRPKKVLLCFSLRSHVLRDAKILARRLTEMSDLVFAADAETMMAIAPEIQVRMLESLARFEIEAFERTRAVAAPRSPEAAVSDLRREEALQSALRQAIWLGDREVARRPLKHVAAISGARSTTATKAGARWPTRRRRSCWTSAKSAPADSRGSTSNRHRCSAARSARSIRTQARATSAGRRCRSHRPPSRAPRHCRTLQDQSRHHSQKTSAQPCQKRLRNQTLLLDRTSSRCRPCRMEPQRSWRFSVQLDIPRDFPERSADVPFDFRNRIPSVPASRDPIDCVTGKAHELGKVLDQ